MSERDLEAASEDRAACAWDGSAELHLLGVSSEDESAAWLRHREDGCARCDSELASARRALASLDLAFALETAPQAEPPPELRARLLERVEAERRADQGQVWKRWRGDARAEGGLSTIRAEEGAWQSTAFDGVEVKPLSVDARRRFVTMLVRMAPGSSYPGHRHAGREECFVLSGELKVGGRVLKQGDYQLADTGSHHGVQSSDTGCCLLIVSSQDDELG
ncbi:MAG TPA: cupin domain-containing protein [Planctomycetota bacterium]|nr:cupin domain-containing protein [Planctomycetota bacterium]